MESLQQEDCGYIQLWVTRAVLRPCRHTNSGSLRHMLSMASITCACLQPSQHVCGLITCLKPVGGTAEQLCLRHVAPCSNSSSSRSSRKVRVPWPVTHERQDERSWHLDRSSVHTWRDLGSMNMRFCVLDALPVGFWTSSVCLGSGGYRAGCTCVKRRSTTQQRS
jgi:hypothetical protein